jgi:hypothetical protein
MIKQFTQEIDKLLGKDMNDPHLQALLDDLQAIGPLETNPDSGGVYVERPALGFCLLLKDPSRILNPLYSDRQSDGPILTTCFYYSEGHAGYSQFSGELPAGVLFTDGRAEVAAKLGEPSWKREKNGRIVAEKWLTNGRSIHLTYSKNQGILILAFGIPQDF